MGALEDDLTEHHRMRTIEDLRKEFLEIESLRKELAEANAQITREQQALARVVKEHGVMAGELATMEEKCRTAEWSRNHERADNGALRNELAEAKAALEVYDRTFPKKSELELHAALEAANADNSDLRRKVSDHEKYIADIEDACSNLRNEADQEAGDAVDAENALEAANARIAELEEQLQKCWQRNLKLSNATTARAERAEAEADSLRATVDNMRAMNIKLTMEATGQVLAAEAECKVLQEASHRIGFWLSAALEDPGVCDAMKADIHAWFAALNPSPAYKEPSEPFDEPD